MVSTIREKILCSKCNKATGIFTCRGCGKDFCYRHVTEHRQELNKQMDEVTTNHDQLQQTITDQEAQPSCHPLMKKIDVWEQQSINKIHQEAIMARKELLTVLSTHRIMVTNDLTYLTQELTNGRNEDDYLETDLEEWTEKLEQLKKDLTAAQTTDFGQDNSGSTLVSTIFIQGASPDFFVQAIGDIQIIENGRVAVHGQKQQNAAVRGKGEYSLGQRKFHFKMEQCNGNGVFSCGIVSKITHVESLLCTFNSHSMYASIYLNPGDYSTHDTNGLVYFTGHNYKKQKNHIVELLIDCDQRMIRLANEQTGQKQEVQVNISTCPFPWQFFITLVYANDRVRLCQEDSSTKN